MGRVVAIVNEKGGAGKTTAVVECAYHAAAAGKHVLVVDLDPQGNATQMLTGSQDLEPSIFDLLIDREGKASLESVVRPALDTWASVDVIPASGRLSTIEGYLGHRSAKERILSRILAPIREKLDLVLIDLGPAADFLTLNALVAADVYHIPADLSGYTITGIQTIHELAKDVRESGANPKLQFGGIHVSGFHKGNSYGVRDLEKRLKEVSLDTEIVVRVPHSSKVIESQAQNRPVGSLDPEGRVSQAYKTLTERLFQ